MIPMQIRLLNQSMASFLMAHQHTEGLNVKNLLYRYRLQRNYKVAQ